jgi:hypothetical protein
MPHLTTDDGVKLHYEEVGAGAPIVFVHEFAGDWRSWEHQLRYFGRRYRCIAYNARGFPPSDVPDTVERYSQERARDDIKAVLDALKIDKAHTMRGVQKRRPSLQQHSLWLQGPRENNSLVPACTLRRKPRRPLNDHCFGLTARFPQLMHDKNREVLEWIASRCDIRTPSPAGR